MERVVIETMKCTALYREGPSYVVRLLDRTALINLSKDGFVVRCVWRSSQG